MQVEWWAAVASGVAVAACCGLRAFLPLFVLGLAGRAGVIELKGGVEWLTGDAALVALAVATVLEVMADKIPVVDHALDSVATVLRPAAAVLAAFAVLPAWPAPWAQLAAVALGGVALGVHGLKASVRLGSTATTGGLGNSLLSLLDDALALLLLTAVVLGSVAVLAGAGLVIALLLRRRAGAPAPAATIAATSASR
jgi:hypothetical protein